MTAPAHRPIWIYSAPGSGASWWEGPPFEVGEYGRTVLDFNHQPIGYPIGGYLGLLGGDPSLSYNQVIADEAAELTRLLGLNPDVQAALAKAQAAQSAGVPVEWVTGEDLELWFTAYSQSGDGMVVAVCALFGAGGQYELLQSRINGLLIFGNPARQPLPDKVGNNAPGSGISRKVFPAWINDLTWSITATTPDGPDFYAACNDEIRPLFYEVIVEANTSFSFFEHVCMLVIPILINTFAPFLGPLGALADGIVVPLLTAVTGLSGGLVSQAVTASKPDGEIDPTDAEVQAKLTALFTAQGIITNIPALITLVSDLGGIQSHGTYDDPHHEFGGRTGVQVATDVMDAFRR